MAFWVDNSKFLPTFLLCCQFKIKLKHCFVSIFRVCCFVAKTPCFIYLIKIKTFEFLIYQTHKWTYHPFETMWQLRWMQDQVVLYHSINLLREHPFCQSIESVTTWLEVLMTQNHTNDKFTHSFRAIFENFLPDYPSASCSRRQKNHFFSFHNLINWTRSKFVINSHYSQTALSEPECKANQNIRRTRI